MDPITYLLQDFVDKGMTGGASAIVMQHDKVVYQGACGYADIEAKTPFTLQSILRMYSMSKVVTSAAVCKLLEDGVIKVTDPVSRYLPGFADPRVASPDGRIVPADREVTLFDLLTMTSGVSYDAKGIKAFQQEHSEPDTVGFANIIGRQPLSFQPGAQWMYGYSCDVLGAVVEVASGMRFGEYLKMNFFDPLGMKDTGFTVAPENAGRIATIYIEDENGGLYPKPAMYDQHDCKAFESGGAGLYSTVPDYARFAHMLLRGGELDGKRILKSETIGEMTKNRLTPQQMRTYNWDDCPGYGYGYAVRTMTDSCLSCYDEENGSFGWNGAAGTSVRIDPKRDLFVVFGTQRRPADHAKYLPQLMKAVAKYLA